MMSIVLWILALPVAAVAVELGARWWLRYRGEYFVLPPGLRVQVSPDPVVFPNLERTVRFEVNGDGERGGDVPRSAKGLYRVLVCGGSLLEGFFLDQDSNWPGALQRILEQPENLRALGASGVHVGCVARSGVGSEALDLILERILPRYPRLQLIIVMVGATDILRWFELNTPAAIAPVKPQDVFRCHPDGPFGWTLDQLATVELMRRARKRWLRPLDVHEGAGRWIGKARAMRARATTIHDTLPDASPMLNHFEHHFRSLIQRAQEHADRVLVVKQPWFSRCPSAEEALSMWHGGVGQAWREEVTEYYSFEASSRAMSLVDARADVVARSLGLDPVDLMPAIEQSLETYYDCFHMTPVGARAVARAVSDAVLQRPAVVPPIGVTSDADWRLDYITDRAS
jgi:lysophospholipase L1-like esterase